MISELGRGLVLASLGCASFGAVMGFYAGASHNLVAWRQARHAAAAFAWLMIAANALMVYALLKHDFSVGYVSEVGSTSTPAYFTVVSLWASLNGSILFWGGILGLYVLGFLFTLMDRQREYTGWTLGTLMSIAVFFSLLVSSIADPFHPVFPVPADGPGPNPLLQNHWLMALHPPTLYFGYVGMAVPFSMICAALFAGRLDAGWMIPLRRWMLVPWTFLTIGIVLGGWWAYEVLGWGGYWAWDPVENASFHPWLTGTAFLHSAMVFQRRGTLRVWTLALGMATFLLTLVGTFMTRSGVFNSVHSFTQSDIGPVFLVFIGICLVFSVVLLAVREGELVRDQEDPESGTSLMDGLFGMKVDAASRELAILLQNAVFTVFTFTVLLGTLYPLITEAVQDRKVSVGEPYFERWTLPLGLMIVFLMGVGPALPWGRLAPERALARLGAPIAFGGLFAGLFAAFGYHGNVVSFTLFLCGFAFWANFAEFVSPVRQRMSGKNEGVGAAVSAVFWRSRRRWGGHIAHYGVIMAVVVFALTKGFRMEKDFTLSPGEVAQLGAWEAKFIEARRVKEPQRDAVVARFTVSKDGRDLGESTPRLNYYPTQREPVFTPAAFETAQADFYLSVVELNPQGTQVVVRAIVMPGMVWLWIAPFVIAVGSMLAAWPDRTERRVTETEAAERGVVA